MGSGAERRWGAKNVEGSGRTADWVVGKRNGWLCCMIRDVDIGTGGGGGGVDGNGDGGLGGLVGEGGEVFVDFFLKGFVTTVTNFLLTFFFNMVPLNSFIASLTA